MKKLSERYLVFAILSALLATFIIVIFNTQNSFGGADNYGHFKLAFWGWKYPDMLFDHWGKPLFTILISPFAQFGFNGARIYNVLMGLFTAFLIWKIAKYFNFNQAWIVVLLVVFMPVYFTLMFTSLTEVTFSFFITLAILLFFKKRYIWSAVIFSLLPFSRTEGVVLMPLFILAFLLKRKYSALPFLLTGFLVFSLAGWPFHESFWWLITDMPYHGSAKDIYGTGTLFHFIHQSPNIFGLLPGIFFILGIFVMSYKWVRKDRFKTDDVFYFLLLVIASFLVFFAAHSYAWWKGIGNSLGLIRVIGSVTPLAALTAMAGVSTLYDITKKQWRIVISVLLVVAFGFFINDTVQRDKRYFHASQPQQLMNEVADYLKNNKLDRFQIVYYDPYLAFKLFLDPRDQAKTRNRLSTRENFLNVIPDSSIIVWDAHFGPNEGRMHLERLEKQKELKKLKVFKPEKSFKVVGGYEYQIVIFQKQ
ncbi:MAG: hypothetical protein GXO86_04830 [Chlorobi bacterium]|nr:hypothetical protein [Chlorobiota bacterium]